MQHLHKQSLDYQGLIFNANSEQYEILVCQGIASLIAILFCAGADKTLLENSAMLSPEELASTQFI
jgi:hypothetical protein